MPHDMQNPIKTGSKTAQSGYISRSLILIIAFGFILLTAIGVAIYFYLQYQNTQGQLTRTTKANEQAALVSEVGKLIVLPTGEAPNIATVSDISKLKGQPFFANARNGDKVLIYTKAQKAILYDPYANKIVDVGPITLNQKSVNSKVAGAHTAAKTASATPALKPVRVTVYNGTSRVGYAASVAKQLQSEYTQITITAKSDAKGSYTQSRVIDLTDKNARAAAILAKKLNAKVTTLPQTETKPAKTDILVILGE